MLHRILSHSPNLGPAVPLNGVLVVGTSSLEEGLIGTSTSGDNSDLGTDVGRDGLLSSRGKTETGGSLVLIVRDDNCEASRSTGEGTTVTDLGLNVADDGSLGHLLQRKNISAVQGSLLTTVNELSSVHTLGRNHKLSVTLETVSVQELNLSNGSSPTRIMENLLHNAADVSTTLGVVDGTELDGSLTGAGVCLEDGGLTLSLGLYVFSHGCFV
mmetsp:Transcript_11239/g.24792  ORF Transcript_11239/g.24792 Transcript_11239/m.24792 type:complete len:214 (-) Transcript_11239:30-671(-)